MDSDFWIESIKVCNGVVTLNIKSYCFIPIDTILEMDYNSNLYYFKTTEVGTSDVCLQTYYIKANVITKDSNEFYTACAEGRIPLYNLISASMRILAKEDISKVEYLSKSTWC